ncbi:MAG: hypothetical protein COB05_05430 [Marinobacter sp.]|nr:MAG: hypothetical protein COB05_05430 [Marinobacter sp.]
MSSSKSFSRAGGLTGGDFSKFLEAKGVGDDCPACNSEASLTVAVYDPEGSGSPDAEAIRMVRRLEGEPNLGYGELMQVCSNCGFIRYFRDIEVMAFLNESAHNA